MKLTTLLITVFMLIALPVLAAPPARTDGKEPAQLSEKSRKFQQEVAENETPERKLHKAFFKKREEMAARRDAALRVRERNIRNNSPGNTGM